ncbi:hypothetical protein HPB50_015172 [Hyalomma asiaticum]|uniref:Uncharacterized protein n=1 Tax=Hyalomma asiaticum TaxID=266040 RepID=A0ACB7S7I8_HYAAI|nr:hypothetical protein HPB50_015172 [Hyalomma asiaticum]
MIGSPLRGRDRSPDPQLLEPGELTPVHQHSSRRLRGDPPEFGPLPAATTTQAMPTADTATMTSPATSSDLVVRLCSLSHSSNHCGEVVRRHTPTCYANQPYRTPRSPLLVAAYRLRAVHLSREITVSLFRIDSQGLELSGGNAAGSLTEPASAPPRRGGVDTCRWLREAFHLTLFLTTGRPSTQDSVSLRYHYHAPVSGGGNAQTIATMLSNAEETLETTYKAATIVASTDHDADSTLSAERTEDPLLGEGIDAESPPCTTVTDMPEEDDIYNWCLWMVAPWANRLPSLSFRDEKVILHPLGGLRLGDWPRPTLATAIWAAAGVSPSGHRDLILRTRPEQTLAVMSTPSSHVADALLKLQELSLGQRTFPVSAYLAAPDDSCKGIVPGLEPGTPSRMLAEEMQAPGIQILQARMMGQTNTALVTFEGPRIRFLQSYAATHTALANSSARCASNLATEAITVPLQDVTVCEQGGIDNASPHIRALPGANVLVGTTLLLTRSALDASDIPSIKLGLKKKLPPPPRRESVHHRLERRPASERSRVRRVLHSIYIYERASERESRVQEERERERREKEWRITAPTLSYTLSTHAGAPPSCRDASALTPQSALLLSTHSPLLRPHHLLRLLGRG